MTPHLLEVNVPIAMVDPARTPHEAAHGGFGRVGHRALATCPAIERGLLRIVGHPRRLSSPGRRLW